ncbi:UNVERIFIED_CONTAM: hypothetical protein FKN15_015892 [Acipenser sinensis]
MLSKLFKASKTSFLTKLLHPGLLKEQSPACELTVTAPDDLSVEGKTRQQSYQDINGNTTARSTLRSCEPYCAPRYWTLASCSNFTTEYYTLQYIKEKYKASIGRIT